MNNLPFQFQAAIPLEEISTESLSEPPPTPLKRSVEQLGLLFPVLLTQKVKRYEVLDGRKRLALLKSQPNHAVTVAAQVLPAECLTEEQHVLVRCQANLTSRGSLTTSEIAEMVAKLNSLGRPPHWIAENLFSLLDLPPSPPLIQQHLDWAKLPFEIRNYLQARGASLKCAAALARLSEDILSTLAPFLAKTQPTFSELRQATYLLQELNQEQIEQSLGILKESERFSLFLDQLKRLRRPEIEKHQREIQNTLKQHPLPQQIKVVIPPDLEGDTLSIQLRVENPNQAKSLLQELSQFIDSEPFNKLMNYL